MAVFRHRFTDSTIAEDASRTAAQLAVEYKANLRWVDLSGANLSEIKINWQSHTLLSELLWQAATTQAQEQLAAWIGRKTE